MKQTLKEFKDFISSGNLVDLAVAFVLGIAVSQVITTFINGIVMNFIAAIVSQPDFSSVGFDLGDSRIQLGNFINACVNLVIVGAVLFVIVKAMNKMKKADQGAEAVTELSLLTEIRDSLKK